MIPLVLTTGFLGSGKTTFLRGVAQREQTRHLVFLVNEFSSLDVDGDLVEEVADDVVRVPGGSIFCRCVVRDFIDQMKAVRECFGAMDGLVVEASGIADPGVVGTLLADTGLDSAYELAAVISLVDPGTLPKLLKTLPNMQSQIRAADLVLVNKCDQFSEGEIVAAETLVRELNPNAELQRTTYAAYEGDILALRKAGRPEGEYAACRDPHYARFEVAATGIQDPEALQRAVTGLGSLLYRLKGVTHTPNGDVRIDAVSGRVSATPVHDFHGHFGLAAICTGGARAIVERKLRACEMARHS
jgi:G3E family GTPase